MEALANFLSMGGYAAFVWSAFAVAAVVMVALFLVSRRSLRADERTLEALQGERRQGRRRDSPEAEGEAADDA